MKRRWRVTEKGTWCLFFFHRYTDIHEFIFTRHPCDDNNDMALLGILASITDIEQVKIIIEFSMKQN